MSKSVLLLLATLTLAPRFLFAEMKLIGQLSEPSQVLTDLSKSNRAMLFGKNGNLSWIESQKINDLGSYSIEKGCSLTASMGVPESVLYFPYLVGRGTVCKMDMTSRSVRLIGKKAVAENSFLVSFAGNSKEKLLFLINAKPNNTPGIIQLLSLNTQNDTFTVEPWVTDVPGYSGGMIYFDSRFFVTVWDTKNFIYELDLTSIQKASENESLKLTPFQQVSKQILSSFDGLSMSMYSTQDQFIYFNPEYDSFLISRDTGKMTALSIGETCKGLAQVGTEWIMICGGTTLFGGPLY